MLHNTAILKTKSEQHFGNTWKRRGQNKVTKFHGSALFRNLICHRSELFPYFIIEGIISITNLLLPSPLRIYQNSKNLGVLKIGNVLPIWNRNFIKNGHFIVIFVIINNRNHVYCENCYKITKNL